jgi:ABC-type multidrug transport system permease subunit
MREVGSGLYSSVMYFIARLVAELPGALFASILASFIVYYMANL